MTITPHDLGKNLDGSPAALRMARLRSKTPQIFACLKCGACLHTAMHAESAGTKRSETHPTLLAHQTGMAFRCTEHDRQLIFEISLTIFVSSIGCELIGERTHAQWAGGVLAENRRWAGCIAVSPMSVTQRWPNTTCVTVVSIKHDLFCKQECIAPRSGLRLPAKVYEWRFTASAFRSSYCIAKNFCRRC
ncbi:UNVERIFIED_ORG: hypothetical protein J2Y81_008037 [Paraburkholderia sediminicola]|nr:hypothetical protein [Paraburkholderia sediminicola]